MERREKTGSNKAGNKAKLNKMGTSQEQRKPRSSEKPLCCSQDQLNPPKEALLPEMLGGSAMDQVCCPFPSLEMRLALTDFARQPEMSSASAPTLWELTW